MLIEGVIMPETKAKPEPTYQCRDCGTEVRTNSVKGHVAAAKLCQACYTKMVLNYEGGGME